MASKKTSSNIERGKLPQPQQLPAHLEVRPQFERPHMPRAESLAVQGAVIRGFGRGSKELGCPTGARAA